MQRLACLIALAGAACGDNLPPSYACKSDDAPSRTLDALLEARGSAEAIGALLETQPAELDAVLVTLFPGAAGHAFVDRELAIPMPYTGQINSSFEATPISFPIDWAANPLDDVSWQLWFQSLSWLDRLDEETAAYVIVDWAENASYLDPPPDFIWSDHALAIRLHAVSDFATRYIANNDELDRRVMHAAATMVVTQVLALASSGCYSAANNHGLMQDISLLDNLPRYPALRDSERFWKLAIDRANEQVAFSVRPDGVHIENSPHYQSLFSSLVLQVVQASTANGRAADPTLQDAAGRLIGALAHQVQPNLTLTQFGDTSNESRSSELSSLVDRARALGIDARSIDELDWIVSRGARGLVPEEVDAVFDEGGYAAFRSGWSTTAAEDLVTAHFRVGHATRTHYHPDETGIEVYGYGSELLIGPGVHGYDPGDPFMAYQYSPAANNVLVVDGVTEVDLTPDSASRVTGFDIGTDTVWVQGTHAKYRHLGIASLVRSFAYGKPDSFAVIDHVRANGRSHRYEQHFHLHPRLSDVSLVESTMVARTADGQGPTITITPATSADIVTEDGWHFPNKYLEEASIDVVVRRTDTRDALDLPVLILVAAPGLPAAVPTNVSYTQGLLRWTQAGIPRSISVPLP